MENMSQSILSSSVAVVPEESSYTIYVKGEAIQEVNNPITQILPLPSDESTSYNDDDDDNNCMLKSCTIAFITSLCCPFIICDLYFAYKDDTCVPNNSELKIYLEVSAYFAISILMLINFAICCFPMKKINTEESIPFIAAIYVPISIIIGVFILIWNIYGAITFWGKIYPESSCGKNINTYLSISIILKLICVLSNIFQKRK
jgi:hypothetical protein